MKIFAAFLTGLGAVGVLSAAAVAEPFNDRSPQPVAYESAVAPAAQQMVMAPSNRFNERGLDYTGAGPVDARTPYMAVLDDYTHFNMK